MNDRDLSARARDLYTRANRIAEDADRWEEARDLYDACVLDSPRFAPAWASLARCHRLIAKYAAAPAVREHARAEAVRAFEQSLALEPELPLAHSWYAQLEVDIGMAPEATVRLLILLERRGPNADAYVGLVQSLRFCGLLDASRTAHDRARALDPAIITSVAHTCWLLDEFDTALFESAGEDGYMPGLALSSMGRDAEAIADLRSRERDTRNNRGRAFLIALRAALEGNAGESLAALKRAETELTDGEALYYIARTYADLGDVEAALAALARVLDAGYICYPALMRDPWLEALRGSGRLDRITAIARAHHERARDVFTGLDGDRLLASG